MFKHAFYLFQQLVSGQTQLEALFYGTSSDDCVLYRMTELTEKILVERAHEGGVERKGRAILALLRVISGQERILYKASLEKDRHSEKADKPYGGPLYRSQRDKARELCDRLEKGGFLAKEAHDLGEHNILIDCHTDPFPAFETIRIAKGTSGKPMFLGDVAPSIHQLKENFRKQACKIRVFINPAALNSQYRSQIGRMEVARFLALNCGLK